MTDEFDVDDLGFEPAISANGDRRGAAERSTGRAKPRLSARTWRRRVTSVLVLGGTLTAIGGTYAIFASASGADSAYTSASIAHGEQLYADSCITCHGANLQGVSGRGPSLIGVGGAAAYFQMSTGRMPASQQGAINERKTAKFGEDDINDIAAYVQSLAGGPETPTGDLILPSDKLAEGGELFRLNCASCHGSTGGGAPLSAGATAPGLKDATDKEIYTAMLTGPENMPVFNDNQLTPEQKKSIVSYIQSLNQMKDPGGHGIGRLGPVTEGLVLWVIGVSAIVISVLWIGSKA